MVERMNGENQQTVDVVDAILGNQAAERVAALRRQKPELGAQLQRYYEAIFEPTEASATQFPLVDRCLVAIRVASHTGSAAVIEWYEKSARAAGADEEQLERASNPGRAWTDETVLGAAMRHADLVTLTPDQTSAADLQRLKAAGLSPAGMLSLAQTIAFVSSQLRLIAGLRALGGGS